MATAFTFTGTAVTPSASDVLTELDAINTMLSTIGETPVTTIDESLPDVAMAKKILDAANRDVQTLGLNSNTEENYEIAVSAGTGTEGRYLVPTSPYETVLRIDASNPYRNVVRRGDRMYDKDNNTEIFTETTMDFDITWMLPFADLPVSTRIYITMKAAKVFHNRVLGSEVVGPYAQQDEFSAWNLFFAEELNTGNYTLLRSPGLSNLRRRF